ncbi:WecB/TagA/CpsF family glycosyltransferase [Deinococcus ruber]|uniref:UDP-N-acetyl-D-mannosaminuronic acid transferase n=1 Tax=Deinococcus ruber TaxID=1848197 RepID=A0A918FC01_9DEIO|nr:WecB/TagA/CpsF family glycosyltransferase [Deinococcus ruber]GGR29205.1 UDP-N-acetyl-D-mannosaminuronic acid transferase [Deinococcus ruber]
MKRTNILGIGVSATNLALSLDFFDNTIAGDYHEYICVTGVHGVMESQTDVKLKQVHNQAGMVTPDGMPLVWLSVLAGNTNVDRVYGPDLMLAVCNHSQERGYKHFFYGGNEGVADILATKLKARYPQLDIVGTYCPPFRKLSPEEDKVVIEKINQSGANIVWVGLSTPKQEMWMADHLNMLEANIMVGVGAAFDFHAGLKKQAPRWIQRSGFEWLYRTLIEPKRLWKRYFYNNPRFIMKIIQQKLGLRKYPL